MSRNPVYVRDAKPEDAKALLALWADFSRRVHTDELPVAETASAVARVAADPDERLLVGILNNEVAGAMHARRAPVSPIHADAAIHSSHLHVLPRFRRHGIGRALMEAAVSWAEEKDIAHVVAVSASSSRDANRFLARLGLSQIAVVRVAATTTLRGKLPGDSPAHRIGAGAGRSVGQVLAQRRSQRRKQSRSATEDGAG